jgi:hypothetical protein
VKKRAGLFANPWSEGNGLNPGERALIGLNGNGNGHKESRGRWVDATAWMARHGTYELEDRDELALRGIRWVLEAGDMRAELSV